MQRILTLCVIGMVLLAGCASAPNASNPSGDGPTADSNSVTYTNETDNSSFEMAVDHNSETYDMSLDGTVEPPYSDFKTNITIGVFCGGLSELAYNSTELNETGATNDSTIYTKTTATGETETVEEIPDTIFNDYEPGDVGASVKAQNGSVLASCSIDGPDESDMDISY